MTNSGAREVIRKALFLIRGLYVYVAFQIETQIYFN